MLRYHKRRSWNLRRPPAVVIGNTGATAGTEALSMPGTGRINDHSAFTFNYKKVIDVALARAPSPLRRHELWLRGATRSPQTPASRGFDRPGHQLPAHSRRLMTMLVPPAGPAVRAADMPHNRRQNGIVVRAASFRSQIPSTNDSRLVVAEVDVPQPSRVSFFGQAVAAAGAPQTAPDQVSPASPTHVSG